MFILQNKHDWALIRGAIDIPSLDKLSLINCNNTKQDWWGRWKEEQERELLENGRRPLKI